MCKLGDKFIDDMIIEGSLLGFGEKIYGRFL